MSILVENSWAHYKLLNALAEYILKRIFPNLCVGLRVFLTEPAIVA